MPFSFAFSDELKEKIKKLKGRDEKRLEILYKKINQIINSDDFTVQHYKNLRHDLSDRKRVHIDKSFVLTFSYNKQNKFILFLDFDHHDKIYKK
ncbi:MAG: addiction module toxin RelE [Candidatus Diapherotrites archaeon]|nr:addiction module toxin RelE [Candidatus Diapherotrites archaeon]